MAAGKKFWSDDTAIAGCDYGWTFDDIGNRTAVVTNGAESTYLPSSLNQYAQRTVPGIVDVRGAASPASTVTVGIDGGAPQSTYRQGEVFFKQFPVDNALAAHNARLSITGVRNNVGPNGEDAVAQFTRAAYVPGTPEVFTYDADGNLTDDAHWHYTWDCENRLIAMETSASAVTAGVARQRLEFTYDAQGRRVQKKVSSWTGGTWVIAANTIFVYDGWNLLAELNALAGNSAVRFYVWGLDLSGSSQGAGGVGGLLFVTDATTSTSHVAAFDGNGNVGGLINATDGSFTAKYDYNAFGELVATEGTYAAANPFQFSTKYVDP